MVRPISCLILGVLGLAACSGRPAVHSPAPIQGEIDIYSMQPTSFGYVFRASLPHQGYPVVFGFGTDGRPRLLAAGGRRPRPLQPGLQEVWADVVAEAAALHTEPPSQFAVTTTDPDCPRPRADGQCQVGAIPLGPLGREFVILLFDQVVNRTHLDSLLVEGAPVGATPEVTARGLQKLLGATASGSWRS